MQLRFPKSEITRWAATYSYPRSDSHLTGLLRATVQAQRYFSKSQLVEVCRWKSPRAAPKAELNDDSFVKAASSVPFRTEHERLRIEVLTLLAGVGWPTASALLHYGVSPEYPIMDVRALWSLGCVVKPHEHCFELWNEYVACCRLLAAQAGVSVRTLDKALWQFSKAKRRGPGENEDG